MASTYKVLAQLNPSATTLTDLYTVPGATSAVISTITVAETNAVATTYRVSVAVAGAANNAKQYLVYDGAISANGVVTLTLGISLAATDVVRVYAGTANVSFNAFGVEIT